MVHLRLRVLYDIDVPLWIEYALATLKNVFDIQYSCSSALCESRPKFRLSYKSLQNLCPFIQKKCIVQFEGPVST